MAHLGPFRVRGYRNPRHWYPGVLQLRKRTTGRCPGKCWWRYDTLASSTKRVADLIWGTGILGMCVKLWGYWWCKYCVLLHR